MNTHTCTHAHTHAHTVLEAAQKMKVKIEKILIEDSEENLASLHPGLISVGDGVGANSVAQGHNKFSSLYYQK